MYSEENVTVHTAHSRDANLWRSQIWRFFFGPAHHPPTEYANATPQIISFLIWTSNPTPLPHKAILRVKRGSICQGFQLVEYSSNQTLT